MKPLLVQESNGLWYCTGLGKQGATAGTAFEAYWNWMWQWQEKARIHSGYVT